VAIHRAIIQSICLAVRPAASDVGDQAATAVQDFEEPHLMAAADRDLLFGLFALSAGLIDQAQLVSAFEAWARDNARSLADHLSEGTGLDTAGRAAVEAKVALYLRTHSDAERSVSTIAADRSSFETVASDADRNATADTEPAFIDHALAPTLAGEDSDHTARYAVGTTTSDGMRFRILRPHAQGGLGAVFVAMDTELHREVALKQILDRHADNPTSRARFLLEAEVTGGLEHPGIVPVYGLGAYSDGRPYYAMRFVRGDTLKEAIDQFHQAAARDQDPGRRSLELRTLLRRFTDVCNAIEYAHSRGILHRDIKPGNIVIGKHGETLVVDWGLAKAQGRTDAAESLEERMLLPSLVSGSAETLPGSAMGTPAYMSPEQARGDLEHVGPRSDVYSLGATLYCLLTGRPPLEINDLGAMLRAVQQGEIPPPRQVAPTIDRALEAVCVKAMALQPEDRYETPRALAEDVERWMADEPVQAHPEQSLERLGRWLRQHRTWTYAAVAALVGISLAATIGVVVVDRARRREADVRKEAQANFNLATKAVDDYLTSVSENTLFKLQDSVDIRRLRQELLNSALKYYKGFVNQRSQDPVLRRQLADAYFRVGEITQEVDSPDQAIKAYREAQAIWEPLLAAHPGDQELEGHLAESYLAVGKLQNTFLNLDNDGAMKSLTRARGILEPLVAANPLAAPYLSSLADCYSEIAIIHTRRQQSAESLGLLEKARDIEKDLINRFPDKHAYQKSLAQITNVLGFAQNKLGNNDQAIHSFRELQKICLTVSEQVKVGPKPLWLLNLLALSHYNIGAIHRERREFDDALKAYEQSLDYRSALVESHPSVTEYQAKLGMSCRDLAVVQHEARQDARAFQSIERSVDVLKALVRAHPDQAGYHSELGLSWNYLGCLYDGVRKNTEGLVPFEQAVAEQQLAVDKANNVNDYRGFLANHLDNLGEQFVDLGRVAEGLSIYRRGLLIYRQINEAHPEDHVYALELLKSLYRLGTTERHDGDSAAAKKTFADLRSILDRWTEATPADSALRALLAAALDREANALFDQGLAEEARERLDRALMLLRPRANHAMSDNDSLAERRSCREVLYVMGQAPDGAEAGAPERRLRSEALWDQARVLRALKLPNEADAADVERVALWKEHPPSELVDLAFAQLDWALVIGYGNTPVSDRARAVRELDLDQAAANLRLAVSRGFRDMHKLHANPDAPILLKREDLKLPIMDMAFPDRPFRDQ
jgi:eukaryotic-like serine/threonine-protein kinase